MRLIDADILPSAEVNGIRGIKFIPKDFIDIAPTVDAVPVVRCKDCKHYDAEYRRCFRSIGYGRYWKPDDFCSCGERKDDETD